MSEMKDLQKLISEKAEKMLVSDIEKFLIGIRDNRMFKPLQDFHVKVWDETEKKDIAMNLRALLWPYDSRASKLIKTVLLPEYIEEASRKFLMEFENIKEQMKQLTGEAENL